MIRLRIELRTFRVWGECRNQLDQRTDVKAAETGISKVVNLRTSKLEVMCWPQVLEWGCNFSRHRQILLSRPLCEQFSPDTRPRSTQKTCLYISSASQMGTDARTATICWLHLMCCFQKWIDTYPTATFMVLPHEHGAPYNVDTKYIPYIYTSLALCSIAMCFRECQVMLNAGRWEVFYTEILWYMVNDIDFTEQCTWLHLCNSSHPSPACRWHVDHAERCMYAEKVYSLI